MLNSLDIEGKPSATRVVVAMSGGVDSSVTAALLADAGYESSGSRCSSTTMARRPTAKGPVAPAAIFTMPAPSPNARHSALRARL